MTAPPRPRRRVARTKARQRRHLSLHARLYTGFAVALTLCAALMACAIYLGVRFLPDYQFATSAGPVHAVATTGPSPSPSGVPSRDPAFETPVPGGDLPFEQTRAITDKQGVWSEVLAVATGALILITAAGLIFGWIFARRLLTPLHSITAAASAAAAGDLSHRINAEGPRDDLQELAETFDTMLERLERSFAAQQRFAADASHELLTPLTTTRAVLQLAADAPEADDLTELLPILRESNERNIAIVRALLHLADAGHPAYDPEPIDLAELASRASRERAGVAAEQGLELRVETTPGCIVQGNTALLHQLVLNLLDNALAYNVPDGHVRLTVRQADHGGAVCLEVANTGRPITAEAAESFFEPFYRAQPRVASDRSGHGLGLAIVRTIAQAHHGTAAAGPRPDGGLVISIRLPRAG